MHTMVRHPVQDQQDRNSVTLPLHGNYDFQTHKLEQQDIFNCWQMVSWTGSNLGSLRISTFSIWSVKTAVGQTPPLYPGNSNNCNSLFHVKARVSMTVLTWNNTAYSEPKPVRHQLGSGFKESKNFQHFVMKICNMAQNLQDRQTRHPLISHKHSRFKVPLGLRHTGQTVHHWISGKGLSVIVWFVFCTFMMEVMRVCLRVCVYNICIYFTVIYTLVCDFGHLRVNIYGKCETTLHPNQPSSFF